MRLILNILVFSLLTSPAMALKTVTVKGDRVLIDLEGEMLLEGDKVLARDANGKPKALLEIKQVKNNKAVAGLLKGQMQQGYSLQKHQSQNSSAAPRTAADKKAWGLLAGYANNTMTVKPSSAISKSLQGSSFNFSGFYQVHLDSRFSARILGSYETLKASEDSATAYNVDISYLGLEALVRYSAFKNSTVDMWAGAGLGFLFAISKTSNVIDTSKISTNQTIVGSLGVDYHLSPAHFIPLQVDYAMFPDNSTSSANQLIIRLGYGYSF